MSARSIWSGTLNFGLISMPVKLYSATRSKTVRFNQLHAPDNVRIQTKRFCPAEEKEVSLDEIVRGYEISPDRYVVIDDAELETLAPEATRAIEIADFVALEEIDPIYYDQPYYVVPNTGGAKSYRLLLQVMRETGKVAIAHVVLRSRERLVAVRPYGDALVMATMVYGDEVNPADELPELKNDEEEEVEVAKRELDVAAQFVTALVDTFDITRYRDTYREAVLELIERKANGEEIVVQPSRKTAPAAAPDLISALEASLQEVRKRGSATVGTNGAGRHRTASKAKAKSQRGSAAAKARRGDQH